MDSNTTTTTTIGTTTDYHTPSLLSSSSLQRSNLNNNNNNNHHRYNNNNNYSSNTTTTTATPTYLLNHQRYYYRHYRASISTFYNEHCIYLPAMLGWFLFSALLSTYNKYVFGNTQYHFPCPLFMTCIHFGCQYIVSVLLCNIAPQYYDSHRVTSPQMTWYEWIFISIPCGIVTSGDVGLSNLSLVRITMTFYTMVKASTPIFVLCWAYIFGIEQITYQLLGVVFIIACGEYFTVMGEIDFDRIGFILCLCASILSGARWTLVQMKLRTLEPPIKSTIATMRLLSPSMFGTLLIFSIIVERPYQTLHNKSYDELLTVFGLGLIGATLAIAMILCEFYLIMHSNAIILMIGGVIKEMVTIFIGVLYFHDTLNRTNIFGCTIVFAGVALYKVIHYIESQNDKQNNNHNNMIRVATSDDDDNTDSNIDDNSNVEAEEDYDDDDENSRINHNSNHTSGVPISMSRKYRKLTAVGSSIDDDHHHTLELQQQMDGLLRNNHINNNSDSHTTTSSTKAASIPPISPIPPSSSLLSRERRLYSSGGDGTNGSIGGGGGGVIELRRHRSNELKPQQQDYISSNTTKSSGMNTNGRTHSSTNNGYLSS